MSTPPNPPLTMEAWVAFLGAHARVVPQVDKDLKSAFGISLTWFDVLYQLSLIPERRLRMQELADALLLSKSGLTRLVDRIERKASSPAKWCRATGAACTLPSPRPGKTW